MATVDFLEEQLGLYRKLVVDESLKTTGGEPARALDVDEAVALALFSIGAIRRRNRAMARASRAARHEFMPRDQSEYLVRLYQSWLEITVDLLEAVRLAEINGHLVKRSDELRWANRQTNSLDFDIDRVRRSIKAVREGRVKPLREAADEFRRRRYG